MVKGPGAMKCPLADGVQGSAEGSLASDETAIRFVALDGFNALSRAMGRGLHRGAQRPPCQDVW